MSFTLKTRAGLSALHCCVGLTDWDMDNELKLATTTDQFHHDDKLSDQHVAQRPSPRASRRKDDFVWYDKTSDSLVKPNLWLLVNPGIACPLREPSAGPQGVRDPAEEVQPARLSPPGAQRRLATEGLGSGLQGAPIRGQAECTVMNEDVSGRPVKNRRRGRTPISWDNKTLKPGSWPRPPVNYCILIALALKSSLTGSLKVQQIYNFTRSELRQRALPVLPDGSRRLEEHHPTQPVLQQQLPQDLQPAVPGRQEEVVLLAPDAGRPPPAEGRGPNAGRGILHAAGAQHGPARCDSEFIRAVKRRRRVPVNASLNFTCRRFLLLC